MKCLLTWVWRAAPRAPQSRTPGSRGLHQRPEHDQRCRLSELLSTSKSAVKPGPPTAGPASRACAWRGGRPGIVHRVSGGEVGSRGPGACRLGQERSLWPLPRGFGKETFPCQRQQMEQASGSLAPTDGGCGRVPADQQLLPQSRLLRTQGSALLTSMRDTEARGHFLPFLSNQSGHTRLLAAQHAQRQSGRSGFS